MQHANAQTMHLDSDHAARLRSLRDAAMEARAAGLDDARRYSYTEGWDPEDAELGWVDADVVSKPRKRLH